MYRLQLQYVIHGNLAPNRRTVEKSTENQCVNNSHQGLFIQNVSYSFNLAKTCNALRCDLHNVLIEGYGGVIKTPKSLAKGTGESSLPSRDNLKLLETLDKIFLVPNTSNLV